MQTALNSTGTLATFQGGTFAAVNCTMGGSYRHSGDGSGVANGLLRFSMLGLYPRDTTANRPASALGAAAFFDTTRLKPIWLKPGFAGVWVDATGATV